MPLEDRDLLMAHHELVCPSCGNLRSECSDPDVEWHAHQSVCYASATSRWALRQLEDRYREKPLVGDALHPLDGVSVFAATQAPDAEDDPLA